jgi:F-type H+/Na+-transporting ATPase subunit beta
VEHDPDSALEGTVAAVRGSVIDVTFPTGLPSIREMVHLGDGTVAETSAHLDGHTVRCLALTPTLGLARGDPARATGAPITIPVGDALLGRAIDVFGNAIDNRDEPRTGERRSIYQPPVPLRRRSTTSEIFETGRN